MSTNTPHTEVDSGRTEPYNYPDEIDLSAETRVLQLFMDGEVHVGQVYDSFFIEPSDDRHMFLADIHQTGRATSQLPVHVFEHFELVGTDGEDGEHVWNTQTNTVYVVEDDEISQTEHLDDYAAKDILSWMDFVEQTRGWADQHAALKEARR